MTKTEAIETLKENLCGMCAYDSQCMESCDIRGCDNRDAIKALDQEPSCRNPRQVDLISRKDALEAIKILRNTAWLGTNEDREKTEQAIEVLAEALAKEPKMVHRETLEQVMLERDVAIEQLKELGYGLGEKIRTDAKRNGE